MLLLLLLLLLVRDSARQALELASACLLPWVWGLREGGEWCGCVERERRDGLRCIIHLIARIAATAGTRLIYALTDHRSPYTLCTGQAQARAQGNWLVWVVVASGRRGVVESKPS